MEYKKLNKMPRTFGRNLHMCFTKIKSPTSPRQDEEHTEFPLLNSKSIPENDIPTPDFAEVYASQRFFFSSPGLTNSITDSTSSLSSSCSSSFFPENQRPPTIHAGSGEGAILIHKFSPDPFTDFRRSMQEMVEARDLKDVRANCDYLRQLLPCYLSLNPKSTHKFIACAFADLLASLMLSSPVAGRLRKTNIVQ